MTNDFKDSSMSLESYMKMDKITKEKLFCEIFLYLPFYMVELQEAEKPIFAIIDTL